MSKEEGRVCSEGLVVLRPVPAVVHVYSSNGETLRVSEVLPVLVIGTCSKGLCSQAISRGSRLEIWERATLFTLGLQDEC